MVLRGTARAVAGDAEAAEPVDELIGPIEVGPIAHGGHCVARHDNRVIFVRHALPGERVRIRLTDTSHDRFWRADAVEVETASADRVTPPCPIAGPGLCGGCDFQHATLPAQRRLKTAVVAEQLQRLAGIDWSGEVEAVNLPGESGSPDGLRWRTRVRYVVDAAGREGLRAHRSHTVIGLPEGGCRIAASGALTGSEGVVTEHAAGREWQVAADGFWQVHPAAADTLVAAVLDGLAPAEGETAFDLYSGVGLFAGALADRGVRVTAVESDRAAVRFARTNLADAAQRVRLVAGRVDRELRRLARRVDVVVLDPPRAGAGAEVVRQVISRRPRAIAYVACDPAALARDLRTAARSGYTPVSIRGFDLFPMTHHIECVAVLASS